MQFVKINKALRLSLWATLVLSLLGPLAKAAPVSSFVVTPTSLVTRSDPARQRIEVTAVCDAPVEKGVVKVLVGDRLLYEKEVGVLTQGTNNLTLLLPEPQKTRATSWKLLSGTHVLSEIDLTWKPPRHWTIYEVFSSHVDIGLHDPQYDQRLMGNTNLKQAEALLEKTQNRDDASRFRYVIEGMWWWGNIERDHPEWKVKKLVEEYVKPGLMGVSCSHSGNRTEVFSTEELCRSTYYTRDLRYRWGASSEVALMVDNNGLTWPLVTAYADAGIKYLGFYPNPWNPDAVNCWKPGGTPGSRIDVGWDSKYPHLFYWIGPGGKRKILVWTTLSYGSLSSFSFGHGKDKPEEIEPIMAMQLAKVEARYPYDVWMVPNYSDNQVPGLGAANRAKAWNAVWRWPELRTVGDLSVPFRQVEERFGDKIPSLSGLMTAGWAQHPLSTPALLADKFAADRKLVTAEKLATLARLSDPDYIYPKKKIQHAWEALICNDEHGYGVSYYKGRPVYDTWMQKRAWIAQASETAEKESLRGLQALASQVSASGPVVFVFNPTLQSRCESVTVRLPELCAGYYEVRSPDGTKLNAVAEGDMLQFNTTDIPPLGYAVFTLSKGTAVTSKAEAVSQPPELDNIYYHIKFGKDGEITSIFDKELKRELLDLQAPYRCNQLVYTQDRNKTFSTSKGAKFEVERSPLAQSVIVRINDKVTRAEIIQRITLPAHEKRIDIDNRLNHVRDLGTKKRWDRFGYFAFPFNVPEGQFRIGLNGCQANPLEEQTGLTTDTYHSARDWAYVGNKSFGIQLVQLDSQLIECGRIHRDKRKFGEKPKSSHLYSAVFNDWLYAHAWTTGPSHINLRYRYTIKSAAGAFEDAGLASFAKRITDPVLAMVVSQSQKGIRKSAAHSFLSVDAGNVELLTLKLSETPGRGVIARFHETEGRECDVVSFKTGWGWNPVLTECTILEMDVERIKKPLFSLDSYGFGTIRFEGKKRKLGESSLTVAKTTDAQVELKWPAVQGASQYHIYCGESAEFLPDEYHLLAATGAAGYRHTGLSTGETNYYRIAAVDAGLREGKASDVVMAVTDRKGNTPPAKIGSFYTGLIDSPRAWRGDTADLLYVQWGKNREADLSHYELYRSETPDFDLNEKTFMAKVLPGPYVTEQFEDKKLKSHTVYYYRVLAVDLDGHKGEPGELCVGMTREIAVKK